VKGKKTVELCKSSSLSEAVRIFSHKMEAVRHHVLAKLDPDQIDFLGGSRSPASGPGFQPSAGKYKISLNYFS